MARYFKFTDKNGRIRVYDGCGCYEADSTIFCGECYHQGCDYTNCVYAGDFTGEPVKWDAAQQKWVADIE